MMTKFASGLNFGGREDGQTGSRLSSHLVRVVQEDSSFGPSALPDRLLQKGEKGAFYAFLSIYYQLFSTEMTLHVFS